MSADVKFFAHNEEKTKKTGHNVPRCLIFCPKRSKDQKKVITFADAQFWDMKVLGGMLPDYWGGYIPPWVCTHGYEEVRNYRKTLFIQSIVENGW